MKIWIDLSNSPHALLFDPIVRALREDGHAVELTARHNAQTVELASARWPEIEVIGGESPRGRAAKVATLTGRVAELRKWVRAHRPDVALSHNSYAQIVAAKQAFVPAVTAMDFEHQLANHLAFRLARHLLLPEAMRSLELERLGATVAKTRFYPGLKEEIHLGSFTPDRDVLDRLGIARDRVEVLIVARTPPTRALYHRQRNDLFFDALRTAARQPGVQLVVLARHAEQRAALSALELANLAVPRTAIDSRSLMYAADLVIGGGGTMTREAALLGVPTYTVFAGRTPEVDTWLERQGLLQRLRSSSQLLGLAPREHPPRDLDDLHRRSELLVPHFVAAATFVPAPTPRTAGRSRSGMVGWA